MSLECLLTQYWSCSEQLINSFFCQNLNICSEIHHNTEVKLVFGINHVFSASDPTSVYIQAVKLKTLVDQVFLSLIFTLFNVLIY